MGLPAKKSTRSAKKSRASHFALKPPALTKCPKCKKPVQPHRVCQFCGMYAGQEVLKIKSKLDKRKRERRTRKKRKRKRLISSLICYIVKQPRIFFTNQR